MKTRLSKALAAALLAIVVSVNIAPVAYAAPRGDDGFGNVGDRIVRFIRDIRHFFSAHTNEQIEQPKP
jgi:hypothetical protein